MYRILLPLKQVHCNMLKSIYLNYHSYLRPYIRSSMYRAIHFTNMVILIACFGLWITIITEKSFELDENGSSDNLFMLVEEKIYNLISYQDLTSV